MEMYSSNSLMITDLPSFPPQYQSPPLAESPPLSPSPPLSQSPPSSEESSFDLFSEDYSENFFPDWSLPTKYTFMAIFFCLALSILPFSVDYPVMTPKATPIQYGTPIQYDSPVATPSSGNNVPGSRNLLTFDKENTYSFDRSSLGNFSKDFITIEDVLNEELKDNHNQGITLSIKDSFVCQENGTMALPLVLSNKIHNLKKY